MTEYTFHDVNTPPALIWTTVPEAESDYVYYLATANGKTFTIYPPDADPGWRLYVNQSLFHVADRASAEALADEYASR